MMSTDLLYANISKHIHLTEDEKAHLASVMHEIQVARQELLVQQGSSCNYIYFVNDGILRAYHLSPNGKDSTMMFALSDWWITDMYCFLNDQSSMVNIQAVEPCTVLRLSKNDFDELFNAVPSFDTYFRILIQNAYCREQLRTIENLSLPAKERYDRFLTKYPQIAQKVTLKQVASYLGITPEFLSAIRAQKSD